MNKIITVLLRELRSHLIKPTFYLSTLGIPLLVGIIFFIGQQAGGEDAEAAAARTLTEIIAKESLKPFGIVDQAELITVVPPGMPPDFLQQYDSVEAGRAALDGDWISTLYIIPSDYRATGVITSYVAGSGIAASSSTEVLRIVLRTNLLPDKDPTTAILLTRPMQLKTVALEDEAQGARSQAEEGQALLLPTGMALLLTMAIFMSAGLLLQAVVEEKENRTVEVLLSSMTPRQLLVGKILGLGALGLLQLAIWLGLAIVALGQASVLDTLGITKLPTTTLVLALPFFGLGYLFFATLMALIGAISGSVRESSQLSAIITLPAAAPLFFLQSIATNPDSGLAQALSLIPLSAPTTMLVRLALGPVPAWQIGLSLVLLALAVVAALWLAGRIFRAATLLSGARPSLKQIAATVLGR